MFRTNDVGSAVLPLYGVLADLAVLRPVPRLDHDPVRDRDVGHAAESELAQLSGFEVPAAPYDGVDLLEDLDGDSQAVLLRYLERAVRRVQRDNDRGGGAERLLCHEARGDGVGVGLSEPAPPVRVDVVGDSVDDDVILDPQLDDAVLRYLGEAVLVLHALRLERERLLALHVRHEVAGPSSLFLRHRRHPDWVGLAGRRPNLRIWVAEDGSRGRS